MNSHASGAHQEFVLRRYHGCYMQMRLGGIVDRLIASMASAHAHAVCPSDLRVCAPGTLSPPPPPTLPSPLCHPDHGAHCLRVSLLTEKCESFRRPRRVITRRTRVRLLAPGLARSKCLVSVSCGVVVAVFGCLLQFHIFENHYSFK